MGQSIAKDGGETEEKHQLNGEGNLLLTDCKLYTGRGGLPSARGLAIEEGILVKVGSELEARQAAPRDATKISIPGAWALPGLHDAHIHLTEIDAEKLDLSSFKTIRELLLALKANSRKTGSDWLVGRGWDQEKLAEKRPPTRNELDSVVSDKPVLLYRVCGHVGVANTKAIEQLDHSSLESELVDEVMGLLREAALSRLSAAVPTPPSDQLSRRIEHSSSRVAESGLTAAQAILSVHWKEELSAIKRLAEDGRLRLRVKLWFPVEHAPVAKENFSEARGLVSFGGAKIFLDGSLGARTAALSEDYSDAQGQRGILNYSDGELLKLLDLVRANGIRPAIHAIGDKAVNQALAVIASLSAGLKRPRIEHASVASPVHVERMKELGVCPVVQPHFATSDWWASRRLGSRMHMLYRFKDMTVAGLNPAGSSDAPVEPFSPLTGIWAAVENPTTPRLEVKEAIDLYTRGSAWAALEEDRLGFLGEGMLGDVTILSDDPFAVAHDRIRNLEVLGTIVNGEVAVRPQWLSY